MNTLNTWSIEILQLLAANLAVLNVSQRNYTTCEIVPFEHIYTSVSNCLSRSIATCLRGFINFWTRYLRFPTSLLATSWVDTCASNIDLSKCIGYFKQNGILLMFCLSKLIPISIFKVFLARFSSISSNDLPTLCIRGIFWLI